MITVVGIDIGYSHCKIVTADHRFIFPSVVGTPERARFGLNSDDYTVLKTSDGHVLVGDGAVVQSEFIHQREDRGWIHSSEYKALMHVALSKVSDEHSEKIFAVTGLPLAYMSDEDDLRSLFVGRHRVECNGRGVQMFDIDEVRVIPQPFGSLFSLVFDSDGKVIRKELFKMPDGKDTVVGILDVGGHTCNVLATVAASELVQATASIPTGVWNVVRTVQRYLHVTCRDLVLNGHQLVTSIIDRGVNYYGERIDLTEVVEDSIAPLAREVIAETSQLWNGGANLDHILITGGGAKLIGDRIAEHFSRHKSVTVLEDSVFANAVGYFRFGKYLERQRE